MKQSINTECIFCRIVQKQLSAHLVFEDKNHLAFLTPFPNTPGFTVVITKDHHQSYGFKVAESILLNLIKTAKKVALLIDENLQVKRTGMIMEGYGVDHLHIKLFPMHGISSGKWQPILSKDKTFYSSYTGMIASNDGPKMPESELRIIAKKIKTGT